MGLGKINCGEAALGHLSAETQTFGLRISPGISFAVIEFEACEMGAAF